MTMQQQLRAQQSLMQAQLRAAQAQVQQYQEQVQILHQADHSLTSSQKSEWHCLTANFCMARSYLHLCRCVKKLMLR